MQPEYLSRLAAMAITIRDLAHDNILDERLRTKGWDVMWMLRYHTANLADFLENLQFDEAVRGLDDELRELLASDPDHPQ